MKQADSDHPGLPEGPPSAAKPEDRPRYIMVGGFLGAGKTTAIAKLAQWFTDKGKRVGLITNDQGSHLVDTAMLAAKGFPVKEIPGGCFCCRFNSLVDAAKVLTKESRPEVFIAEPVGSCTDLVATVAYPLRQLYGEDFAMAPLSVLVDPIRALRILGLEEGGKFSDKVVYIYRKQLEEADLIVINKCDLLTSAQSKSLEQALKTQFPAAQTFLASARQGSGLEDWFAHIASSSQGSRGAMEVNYEDYAVGEARLGWLNGTVNLTGKKSFDGNELLQRLAAEIHRQLDCAGVEVAHLKMTLDPDNGLGEVGVVNLVRNDFVPELSQGLPDAVTVGELTINMRAEAAPETLRDTVQGAVAKCAQPYVNLPMKWAHLEFFRPGKPQPTHRLEKVA
jgi:G3E family GTPase